jgi:cell wall assembly regulator SMI1
MGNLTSNTISGLVSGATYYFAVTAIGTNGLESDYSAEVSYTVPLPTNNPPTIALTSPANGVAYAAPASIPLAANVIGNGHTITQVQFYNGATLLGAVATAPYSFSWNNVSAGTYGLSAKAVYDSGSTVVCTSANVTVTNAPTPSIVLSSPANGASYVTPATIPLAASVTANGHAITQVQF